MGAQSRRSPDRTVDPVTLPLRADLPGRLVRRYKRFLADVEMQDGSIRTVHCPNPGSMTGTDRPGSLVRCSTSRDPKRKLAHTLEMIRVGRVYVGLHAARANQLVAMAIEADAIPELRGYATIRPEVRVAGGSRLDFELGHHESEARPAFVEVKSVTLAEGRTARFPDAVTTRGRRHLEELITLRGRGARAMMLFVVQRADCDRVEPADDIDPGYGAALRTAAAAGVELLALRARVTGRGIRLEAPLPVLL